MRLRDVLTNELVIDIVGTFGNLGGGEAGGLWVSKSGIRSFGHREAYVLNVGVVCSGNVG